MTKEKVIPQIRFSGFTDTWEQRKLGDTVQITMGQSPDGSTYSDVPSDYILVQGNADLQNGWVSPRVWTSQMTKKADAGDLIMSVRAPAGAMGKTAYNAVIGRGVAAIKGNEFIYQLLEKMDSDGYWKALSCGSTFESLNSDNIKNADVLIPDVAEQEKIGEYFLAIDRLITLHQRKYDKLTKVKKAMLEKMFPENGSPYPEIRFKGFTDAWEQRKLGEISESFEYGLNAAATEYDGKHKYIRITDIDDSTHLFLQDDLTSPDIDFSTADDYLLQEGDVLFARTGASVGKTYIYRRSDGDLYFAGFLIRAKIKSDYDADFVFQNTLTDSYDSYIRITSQRSGQPGVNAQEYANFALSVPSLAEQKKIGAYFSHLDSLITLHQRKLEKLKNIKKACLEKMFV